MKSFSLIGRLLRALLARRGATIVHLIHATGRRDLSIVHETRALTQLLIEDAAAFEIMAYGRAALRLGGAMAEAGVFAGGTARLLCEIKGDTPLHLFDVFETLQSLHDASDEASKPTRAAELRAHFRTWHSPREWVDRLLSSYPAVHLHVGVFPETTRGLEDVRFSFAHLDFDLESSTTDALTIFHPRLVPGGIIVGDDYNLPAIRRAFDTYFANHPDTIIALPWGQVVAIKVSPTTSSSIMQSTDRY
jgi:O-methyltransferase